MLFKQLFLCAKDPITVWQLKQETFSLIEANINAKKQHTNQQNTLQDWFEENEVPLITSLCQDSLTKQTQQEHTFKHKHFTAIPLSSDTVAIYEKKAETLLSFLTSSSEITLLVSPNQIILDHSSSCEIATGFSSEDIKDKHLLEFIHPDDRSKVMKALKNISTNSPSLLEWRMWTIRDTYMPLEASFSPIFSENGPLTSILIIGRDISERKKQEEVLYHLAFHDPLTELPNRRLFMEQFKQTLLQFERKRQPFAVLLLDCDHFKSINDTYGHDIGDEVIKGFGARIQCLIRKSDILSRFGGDEFALLLPEVGSKKDVERIAKRIISDIQAPWVFGDLSFHTTTSVGIFYADASTPNVTIRQALKNADIALYKAKKNGKNHFQLYEMY